MKKGILLAAMACVAMFALPAVASAGVWHVTTAETFTGSGGVGFLTQENGSSVECTTVTVHGTYSSTTGGTVKFTFHGCKGPFGVHCTTSGQPTGTITTTVLPFDNVRVGAGGDPGILITPGEGGHFATFTCFGITTKVSGNGLIGTLNKKCGEKSNSAIVSFESSAPGVPKDTRVTTNEPQYTLESSVAGGSPVMASEDASGSIGFAKEQTINCT